jgi:hypothetical protein
VLRTPPTGLIMFFLGQRVSSLGSVLGQVSLSFTMSQEYGRNVEPPTPSQMLTAPLSLGSGLLQEAFQAVPSPATPSTQHSWSCSASFCVSWLQAPLGAPRPGLGASHSCPQALGGRGEYSGWGLPFSLKEQPGC